MSTTTRILTQGAPPLTPSWAEHSIPDRFALQVAQRGEKVAIQTRDGALTYRMLDQISNRIANAILEREPTDAVCLLFEHDAPVPVAIFGVLKSGKFYVTLDPAFPRERNEYILRDSDARVIVTNARNLALARSLAQNGGVEIVDIDALHGGDERAPCIAVGPDRLAFVAYTSGSTGEPKGVMQSHRSVLHKILRHSHGWQVSADDRISLLFSYNFGASVSNIFAALLNGATLLPCDIKAEPAASVLSWLREERITLVHTVPTYFRHLTANMSGAETFPDLRLIRIAGETVYGNDVRLFQRCFGSACVLQVGMGSTETGTILQSYFDASSECPEGVVPPGYPTEDMEILLLDEQGKPVGPDEEGEITVRSRYLFEGYWRRPDLTAAVLRDDPASDARLYSMRDLGKRLPDGRITHLGRKDTLVKIRGARVELGEVELALMEIPGVAAAAVTAEATENASRRLIAHVVRKPGSTLPVSALRGRLRKKLPDYMMPSAFLELDALPLTTSGKVDRRALAARPLPETDRALAAPRDHLEAQLVAIWEDLLRKTGFGIREDFFELGGDSLLAAQMTLEIERVCGREIDLGDFATSVTIEALADRLEAAEHDNLRQPLLEIQVGGGAKPPIFFCHGDFISGGVFCRALARHLGPEQPFYAIPPHGFEQGSVPPTISAMAADRVKSLLAFRPQGPFILGGFCWGGFVALEMARELRARGLEVGPVLLIDTDPRTVRWRPMRRAFRRLGAALALDEETELGYFLKCREFLAVLEAETGFSARSRFVLHKLLKLGFSRGMPVTKDDEQDGAEQEGAYVAARIPAERHDRWFMYHRINQSHVPEPYAGPVVLFRSSRLQERYPDDPIAGWRRVSDQVATCDIAGDHWTCVTRHVEDLTSKMRVYLPLQR